MNKVQITQNKVMEPVCRLEGMAGKAVFGLFSSTVELLAFLQYQQPY
jgi:hypothetical protein